MVVLSFVVAQVVVEHTVGNHCATGETRLPIGGLLPALRITSRALAFLLFALTIVAGLYGTADPLMNFAPTMVWIIWWVGLSLIVACVGNIWPALDPWRTLYDVLDRFARRMGATRGLTLGWRYPAALGTWPAACTAIGAQLVRSRVSASRSPVPARLRGASVVGRHVAGYGVFRRRHLAAQRRRLFDLFRDARPLCAAARATTHAVSRCARPAVG